MSLDDQELSALVRQHATRHTASDRLRAAIRTQTALAEAGRVGVPRSAWRDWSSLRARLGVWRWSALPISFALGMLCMALAAPLLQRWATGEPIEAALVADHVRALQVGPVAEVVSTDRHTVKPWFQGRLDFAPPVFDLAAEGFPLLGGRVEHVSGQAVAALAYTHHQHVVDVFVWPGDAHQLPLRSVHRGFNVVHWADGAMQVWAVSDMDAAEMENFARLWRARAAVN